MCSCNCRSTPCSLVKADEEWRELSACESGENCGSSHTRTEQQFHPEVLLSPLLLFINGIYIAHLHHTPHVQRILLACFVSNVS